MRSIKHVTNTWLFALALHPVIFIGYSALLFNGTSLEFLVPVIFFGFIFSIPAFAFCLILIEPLQWIRINRNILFLLWIFVSLFCVYAGSLVVLILFFDFSWHNELSCFIHPAYISVILSVCIRRSQFMGLVNGNREEWAGL